MKLQDFGEDCSLGDCVTARDPNHPNMKIGSAATIIYSNPVDLRKSVGKSARKTDMI